ncbi:MAG: penicillin-insensitive murein endopeptidase [Crocinitomicaceae bacterium]
MKTLTYIALVLVISACNLQAIDHSSTSKPETFTPYISLQDSLEIMAFCQLVQPDKSTSKTVGTVSKGSLKNGKLIPYFGSNYTYFYKESYLASRAYTSDKVMKIILKAYDELKNDYPLRHFFLMELSNKNGGKMFPHKTHQNGLSVDFMMPKLKNNEPFYGLDTIGKDHYWLDFNDSGEQRGDSSIKIDFELMAHHILILQKEAQKIGYQINKVIVKIEYKDELLAGPKGQLLDKSGIYIVKKLTPVINNLHDEHFHIDFEKI